MRSARRRHKFIDSTFRTNFSAIHHCSSNIISNIENNFSNSCQFTIRLGSSMCTTRRISYVRPLSDTIPLLQCDSNGYTTIKCINGGGHIMIYKFPFRAVISDDRHQQFVKRIISFMFRGIIGRGLFGRGGRSGHHLFVEGRKGG